MRAIQIVEPWDVREIEAEEPVCGEGMALLKVHAVGICGSDIGAYRGTNNLVSYPRVIGHEIAGEVVRVCGSNPKGLKEGDRVVVDPYLYCGKCYPCSIGRTNCCDDLKVLGVHVDGGMSEYFAHPAGMLVRIPEGMSWEMAALAEPLTISLHGVHRGGVAAGEYCAFYGAGPIGLLAAMVAKHYGAEPILIDIVDERLEFARRHGIANTVNSQREDVAGRVREITGGLMAQMVMEASGSNAAIRGALDIVSNAGRVVFTGWPKNETSLPTGLFTKKELDVRGARTSAGEFEEALDIIAGGKIDIASVLTEVVGIDGAADKLRDIEKNPGSYMKVVVRMD